MTTSYTEGRDAQSTVPETSLAKHTLTRLEPFLLVATTLDIPHHWNRPSLFENSQKPSRIQTDSQQRLRNFVPLADQHAGFRISGHDSLNIGQSLAQLNMI